MRVDFFFTSFMLKHKFKRSRLKKILFLIPLLHWPSLKMIRDTHNEAKILYTTGPVFEAVIELSEEKLLDSRDSDCKLKT